MIKPKVVLLIFVSGKIVLTGAKVTGHFLDINLLVLPILTFPSVCEGAGGDIHGVQHDLHRAMRVPQAVTTASHATPPLPHSGGTKLRYCAHMDTSGPLSSCSEKTVAMKLSVWYTCTFPPTPTLQVYIHDTLHKLPILGIRAPFVLVIVPPMTIAVYGEVRVFPVRI